MPLPKDELLKRIHESELRGEFDAIVEPINPNNYDLVGENYQYLCKGFIRHIPHFLMRGVVLFAGLIINGLGFGLKVRGRKNLRGVKAAVLTCNHVNDFDNLMVRQAAFGHRLYIVVGEFNNKCGLFGKMLKAGGALPISSNFRAMVNFRKAVEKVLSGNNYVLFYPEESEWWLYEKPRPFKNGAFHFAATALVPVVPMFITFSDPTGWRKLFIKRKAVTLHIMPPIAPEANRSARENIDYLRDACYRACAEKYVEFYRRPLVFETAQNPAKQENIGDLT